MLWRCQLVMPFFKSVFTVKLGYSKNINNKILLRMNSVSFFPNLFITKFSLTPSTYNSYVWLYSTCMIYIDMIISYYWYWFMLWMWYIFSVYAPCFRIFSWNQYSFSIRTSKSHLTSFCHRLQWSCRICSFSLAFLCFYKYSSSHK